MILIFFFRSLWWLVSFRWLYNVIRILWIIANNLYVIPAYFAWMVIFSPIFLVSPSIFWGIEDVLFGWLLNMVACWNHTGIYVLQDRIRKLKINFSKISVKMIWWNVFFRTIFKHICNRTVELNKLWQNLMLICHTMHIFAVQWCWEIFLNCHFDQKFGQEGFPHHHHWWDLLYYESFFWILSS